MVSFNFLNLLINNISFYTTSLFFLYFLISSCLLSSTYWKKILYNSSFIINFFIINVITILLLFILFFFFKYIYILNTLLSSVKYYKNYTSIFSDTLVLLAIIVTVISWVFLSERYLVKTFFFVIYFLIFIICTINMVYTTNILVMFIFFEFIFLPSLFFVYQFGYSKKVEKTIAYLLLWTLTGSFIVLFGIIYLFSIYKTLDIYNLNQINFSSHESFFLFFIFFFGFGIKIPLWPFHYWLTKVHVEAPTGFSIFLSGFLVKTAFFCLTYFFVIFSNKLTCLISSSIVIWGAIDASIRMWSSNDIKKLIAFATIQEMNLIMFLFIFLKNFNNNILNLFLLVHGVLSAFLFYLVDQVQKQTGTRNLTAISGLSNSSSILHTYIWIAILIFRGFPIFIKFFIEWELLSIFYLNFKYLGLIYFMLINFFAVIGFARVWFSVMYGQPSFNIKSNELLKKDYLVGLYLIIILFVLNFMIILF